MTPQYMIEIKKKKKRKKHKEPATIVTVAAVPAPAPTTTTITEQPVSNYADGSLGLLPTTPGTMVTHGTIVDVEGASEAATSSTIIHGGAELLGEIKIKMTRSNLLDLIAKQSLDKT